MIVLGVPVLEMHDITEQMFLRLLQYVTDPSDIQFVLIDNGSKKPYKVPKNFPFKLDLIRNKKNLGYYYPLQQLYEKYPDADFIGLMHNDMLILENGWDQRIRKTFAENPKIGLIGLFGARTINEDGTENDYVTNFLNAESNKTGMRNQITDKLEEVLTLDSLFMLFRKEVIPALKIDKHIPLCHLYDKVWSLRTREAGWQVAVLGVLFSHKSDTTSKSLPYYESASAWFKNEHGIAISEALGIDYFIWVEARARYLMEFRELKKIVPCTMK